jgi:hypothetical protein
MVVIQQLLMGTMLAFLLLVRLPPFSPTPFPARVLRRYEHHRPIMLTGRRLLESYLLLLLTSSSALHAKHDVEDIVSRTLNTYVLGEHVGPVWGLGRVLRWTPTVSAHKLRPDEDQKELLKSVGLYKVQGDAVAAVMGGIYQQFVRFFLAFPLCSLSSFILS